MVIKTTKLMKMTDLICLFPHDMQNLSIRLMILASVGVPSVAFASPCLLLDMSSTFSAFLLDRLFRSVALFSGNSVTLKCTYLCEGISFASADTSFTMLKKITFQQFMDFLSYFQMLIIVEK